MRWVLAILKKGRRFSIRKGCFYELKLHGDKQTVVQREGKFGFSFIRRSAVETHLCTFNNNNKIIIWAEGRGDSFSTRRPDDVLLSVADMFPEQNNALLGVSK